MGRLVVPKALRAELGITGPTELEVTARDGVIELAVPMCRHGSKIAAVIP